MSKDRKRFERLYCIEIKKYFTGLKDKIISQWGNKSLYDAEITDIGRQLLGKKYIGTFPVDKVPLAGSDKYMIVNCDMSGLPGSHWVALHIRGDKIYIYDSFARKSKVILKPLYDRVKKSKKTIVDINAKPDQKSNSEVCGPISLAWLYVVYKHGIRARECI